MLSISVTWIQLSFGSPVCILLFSFPSWSQRAHLLFSKQSLGGCSLQSQWQSNNKVNVYTILEKLGWEQVKLSYYLVFMALIECQSVPDPGCHSCLTLIAMYNLWHSIKTGNKANNGSIYMLGHSGSFRNKFQKAFLESNNPYSFGTQPLKLWLVKKKRKETQPRTIYFPADLEPCMGKYPASRQFRSLRSLLLMVLSPAANWLPMWWDMLFPAEDCRL